MQCLVTKTYIMYYYCRTNAMCLVTKTYIMYYYYRTNAMSSNQDLHNVCTVGLCNVSSNQDLHNVLLL